MNERKESLPNDDYIGETSICRKLRLKSMKLLTLKVPEILSVPGGGGSTEHYKGRLTIWKI